MSPARSRRSGVRRHPPAEQGVEEEAERAVGLGANPVAGDIATPERWRQALPPLDAVIHLACISNDPSFELTPELSRSINYDCFEPMVAASKAAGVKRFIYASTSSVYGVSDAP